MVDLASKVILVTGGTSGIGRGIVEAAARARAQVVSSGRRLEQGRVVEAAVVAAGGNAWFVQADVTREPELEQLVAATIDRFGRLDGACNNAGVELGGPLTAISFDDYRRVFDVNFWGVACAMKHQATAMIDSAGGSIVNISSIAGHTGIADFSLYNASKHAVEGLTKTAALELARYKIRVNAVAPAFIATPMVDRFVGVASERRDALAAAHPVGRLGEVSEVAAAALFLLSDASPFIIGESLAVDGGWLAR
jgi:NAD(P)-dependent dehydrogenase (short-subunit alcohol dehydrogenase family)